MSQKKQSNRLGFTLIELLVVIAIIAILAAILFPVFARVREKARQISCLSNEKQLSLAFLQYNQDYDELYPSGVDYNQGSGWAGEISSYVKSTGVYHCPDDPTTQQVVAGVTLYPVSYALNFAAAGVNLAQWYAPASTTILTEIQGSVVNVSDTLETGTPHHSMTDFSDNLVWVDGSVGAYTASGGIAAIGRYNTGGLADRNHSPNSLTSLVGGVETPGPRHTTGANWLMADGHAKYMNGNQVASRFVPFGWQPAGAQTVQAWMWPSP